MKIYFIKNNLANRCKGIFTASGDAEARMIVANSLFNVSNPIGLEKQDLISIGECDETTGAITQAYRVPVKVVALDELFNDVLMERKKYAELCGQK